METRPLADLAALRIAVGYLGEQNQYNWWPSAFFTSASSAFLGPIFPRNTNLARYTGVTCAAALVHDERIGVGRVYHLFRLPEDLEQGLHRVVQDNALWQKIAPHIHSVDEALAFLRSWSEPSIQTEGGPVRIGSIRSIRDSSGWPMLAAHYACGLESERPTYPYFTGDTP
jgi:hypothetical protein